ncbi:Protein RTA1 [Colletotrichum orbiculare MAFF 240422]|uniref:Protein RTA1 n=1 Tax=Colletotrichum orbiculare (strain 104-T / ATCC 96160 / CBS 514.97 / LARS 414 / MAFF 240422) TaxID=1213857 RepID=A0A484FE26_COLOR|nr:Protein RTA1 [Colletotrichum orbiculare MAFF 240422]
MDSAPAGSSEAAFDFQLYRYTPSLAAAVVSVIVFAALTVLHTWRLWKAKAFYFTAFTVGGVFQTIGYAGRIWSHYDKFSIGGFIIQAILILVAPALYAASIYMILGRLIRTVKAEHLSLVPVRWVTRIFVTGDVVAFGLQAGGGGIQAAGTLEMYEMGEKIIIAGLFVQILVFGFFVITSVLFHVRLLKRPTDTAITGGIPWRRYLSVLYVTSIIILVRSIFRVVEYLQGNSGYLISHELFLYLFDALLMALVMAVFSVWVSRLPDTPSQVRRGAAELSFLCPKRGYGNHWIPPTTPTPDPGTVSGISHTSFADTPNFDIQDLALLHHWTISTSVDIYKTPSADSLWQRTLPQIGFQYPFVAHAILSLAALHLAHIEGSPSSPYVVDATRHHEIALVGFHECVNNLTRENSEALLAWSILNLLYVFSISKQLSHATELSSPRLRKDRLLGVEWIPMVRGIDAVLGPHYDFLREGRMAGALSLGNWHELNLDDHASDAVDQELCRLRDAWRSSSDAEVYDEALHIMRKCLMYAKQFDTMDEETLAQWGFNRAWAGPMAFIHFAPQQYFTLLHQRQPHSLIIFAYFGAFLHMLDDYWFLEGWGRDIVGAVDELLGSYWQPWICWPIQTVGLDAAGNP